MGATLSRLGGVGRCPRPFEGVVASFLRDDVCFGLKGSRLPCDVFDGSRVRVHQLMAFFIYYYCDGRPCRVLDPTCGRENYQFSKLLRFMDGEGVEYVGGDIMPYGSYRGDVFRLPFRGGSFDLAVYDPPYAVGAGDDPRCDGYSYGDVSSVADIRRFYSREVLAELWRVLRPSGALIVKGSNLYYPRESRVLRLFIPDILSPDAVRGLYYIEAAYTYRHYVRKNHSLYRAQCSSWGRPLITSTIYAVLRKV